MSYYCAQKEGKGEGEMYLQLSWLGGEITGDFRSWKTSEESDSLMTKVVTVL